MLISTYLAQSGIHGSGLFAGEPIAKGTLIWEFLPGLDSEIAETHLQHENPVIASYLRRYTYPHPHKPGFVILDGDHGRFMNHSTRPNTDFATPDKGYAKTDIPMGAELTCDYGEFAPGFVLE